MLFFTDIALNFATEFVTEIGISVFAPAPHDDGEHDHQQYR
jgi:hypothetical protein